MQILSLLALDLVLHQWDGVPYTGLDGRGLGSVRRDLVELAGAASGTAFCRERKADLHLLC